MTFEYNILNLYQGDVKIKKKCKYCFKITFNSVSFLDDGDGGDGGDGGITNIYEWLDCFNKLKDEPFNFTKHDVIYARINGNPPSYVYLYFGFVKIVDEKLVFYVCSKINSNKFYSKIPQGRFIRVNFSFSDSFSMC